MAGGGQPSSAPGYDPAAPGYDPAAAGLDAPGYYGSGAGVSPENFFTGNGPTRGRGGDRGDRLVGGRGGGPGGRGGGPAGTPPAGRGRKRFIDFPRYGRHGFGRWIPSWRLVSVLTMSTVILLVAAFLVAYAATPFTPPDQATAFKQTSFVYYSDGTQIGQFKEEQREVVDLQADGGPPGPRLVPLFVQRAVLSAEDRTFYANRGISPTGILRALVNNVRGGSLQGGSTITQQYVKNFFTGSDRSLTRKAKEFLISLKVAQKVPKNDILKDYLNKIYFGRNAYGIQAAAVAYFGKNVGDLSVSQGAFLAGIIDGPELYNFGPDELDSPPALAAQARWRYVLDGMVAENWLSAAQERTILTEGLPPVIPRQTVDRTGQRGYLMDMIEKEFTKLTGLDSGKLRTGGYIIRTTFRKDLLKKTADSVAGVLGPRKSWPVGTQVGIASVDPKDGAILSIYGGDDTTFLNSATQYPVIAGSTFKPFALIAALKGNPDAPDPANRAPLSLRSRFSGESPYTLKIKGAAGKKVNNFGPGRGERFGMIDLMKATAESVNTVYAQLNERVDPKFTVKTAVDAGLPPRTTGLDNSALNVLGSASPHVIDMASAYATIAAEGTHHEPFMITQITSDHDRQGIYTHQAKPSQPFSKEVMADTSYAMQQVIKRGTGTFAQGLGRPAAGKTGTSSGNLSAWFVGFTPQLSTAVGMYREKKIVGANGKPTTTLVPVAGWGKFKSLSEVTGGTIPIQVWTSAMKSMLKGAEVKPLPDPVFGGDVVNPAPPPPPSPSPSPSGTPSPSDTGQPGEPGQPGSPTPTDQPGGGTPSPGGQPSGSPTPQPSGQSGGPPATPSVASASGVVL